jgi:hypothetical protein
MPKSIQLQNTEQIPLDTGEMTAVAIEAIKKESRRRKRDEQVQFAHGIQERIKSYLIARVQERSALWEEYFNGMARKH